MTRSGCAKTPEAEAARRRAISEAKKGRKHSEAHRKALSESRKRLFAEGKLQPSVTHHTPEMCEHLRQTSLAAWEEGRLSNKGGLVLGASRTTQQRSAAWTPEKRAAQAARTTQAYREGRMDVHGCYKGVWSLYDGPKGQIRMRSQSELLFAYKLDWHDLDWQYEPQRFDLGWSTYLPDFYLPAQDLWVEVKGHLSEKAARKIADFIALGHRLVVTTYREVREAGLPSELKEVSLDGK